MEREIALKITGRLSPKMEVSIWLKPNIIRLRGIFFALFPPKAKRGSTSDLA